MDQLTEKESQMPGVWNGQTQIYPQNRLLPELIAEQAASRPTAMALTMGEESLSYAQLDQRANQVAQRLLVAGMQQGMLIGVFVERSLDVVVALLGILQAGGVYVPLDPTYPRERLEFMVQDASLTLMVTQRKTIVQLPIQERVQCIFIDENVSDEEQNEQKHNLPPLKGEDLAYTIYTSGSTGQPKGVQVTHQNLLNLIYWHRQAFELTAADRATQVSSIAFDATGWELWPYLSCGAQIFIADERTRTTPLLLHDWLIAKQISITFLPTPIAEEMMQLDWPATGELRYMLTGADRLRRYPPESMPFALINNYGPTEATVVATSGRVLPAEQAAAFPSIGCPISNTQIYILDEQLQQVANGEIGEIYIGGAGLARGYINRPDLTAQRFIQHPFSSDAQARLYKTGDLAYYLPDGQIAFVGRNDRQVKIRGFRIELGEIETVLNQHPTVARAVVLDQEALADTRQLVAYVQPHDLAVLGDQTSFQTQVRQSVVEHLPDYMVPAHFVLLADFPLTHNGKIDYAALPAIEVPEPVATETAENGIEQEVAQIIRAVLKQEEVGPDDNFFMLGGHSLLGAQVIANVSRTFAVDLPLRALFNAPTVRLLAVEVEARIIAKLEAMSEEEVLQYLAADSAQ